MSGDDVQGFFRNLGVVLLWTGIAVAIALVVFEIMDRRYHLMKEVFEENSVGAGVLAGAIVLSIFYVVAQLIVGSGAMSEREERLGAGPVGSVLSVLLALLVAAVALRLIAAAHRDGREGAAAPPDTVVPALARTPRAALPSTSWVITAPERPTPFADLREASAWLGYAVWEPGALPPGVWLTGVAWQPLEPVLVPGLLPVGELVARYNATEREAVLLLRQGPGVGLRYSAAPDGMKGQVILPNGQHVLWVGVHQGPYADLNAPGYGQGNKLRVGVAPVPGELGWLLESDLLDLDALLQVAAALVR